MWDLMLTGVYSPKEIWTVATTDWGLRTKPRKRIGGALVSLSGVYRVLTNPFYAGVIEHDGRLLPGKHEAMITLQEFERVQDLLGRPHRPRAKTRAFAYTGLIRCGECGFAVTAEEKTNRFGSRYTYYHCSKRRLDYRCQQPCVSLAVLEDQIARFLDEITLPDAFHRWVIERLERAVKASAADAAAARHSLEQTLAATRRELGSSEFGIF